MELIEYEHTNRLRNRIGIKIKKIIINENANTGYCASAEFLSLFCCNTESILYSPIVIIIVLNTDLHGVINGVR